MDDATLIRLLVELHRDGHRQGPGADEESLRALELARLDETDALQVADIGCGTGAATIVIADRLRAARIVAVDLYSEFLTALTERARAAGHGERIETRREPMEALTFEPESLDLIWSEGAIYNIGFRRGINAWRRFLRPGGVLAVSEITWLRPDPPEELRTHWGAEYPEIAGAPRKIAEIERAGYDLLGYFVLPANAWIDNYYAPTERRIPTFLRRHADSPEARQLVAMEREEAELYARFREWFSYGFYVARRR